MAFKALGGVVVLVLYFHFHEVTTLECYSCTSTLGSNFRCENLSYSGNTLPYYTCMYGDAVCAKYIIEYGDSLMIHRGCQHRDVCAVLASRYNNFYNKLLDCQTCSDHNYCNGANVFTTTPIVLFLGIKLLFNSHVLYL